MGLDRCLNQVLGASRQLVEQPLEFLVVAADLLPIRCLLLLRTALTQARLEEFTWFKPGLVLGPLLEMLASLGPSAAMSCLQLHPLIAELELALLPSLMMYELASRSLTADRLLRRPLVELLWSVHVLD